MKTKPSALFPHEKQHRVSAKSIMLTAKAEKELQRLQALPKERIDLSDPDAPEIKDWRGAMRGQFYRPLKQQISIRLDMDVIDWFKHQSGKYQSLINAACREYMEKHALS